LPIVTVVDDATRVFTACNVAVGRGVDERGRDRRRGPRGHRRPRSRARDVAGASAPRTGARDHGSPGARDPARVGSGHLTTSRNDPEGSALSCQNDEGSSPPTTVPGAVASLNDPGFMADAPGDAAGRSRSATGETLTRRHQRAERSTARCGDGGGAADDPFERWVDRQLRALYGPVADEPLPPRLRALLDRAERAADRTSEAEGDRRGGDGHDADG
jgi:hypothetical protein